MTPENLIYNRIFYIIIKTKKFTTPESKVDDDFIIMTIPISNLKKVNNIKVTNGGKCEILSQDNKGAKVKLTENKIPGEVKRKNKYSKTVKETYPLDRSIEYKGNIPKKGGRRRLENST